MTERRGLFITFEGLDGSGKSTQMDLLARRLAAEGHPALVTVEPGGTRIGAQIRRILLDAENHALAHTAELLLYFASRAQNVEETILPALCRNEIVICDRFTDSTLAYQSFGRGLGEPVVAALHRIACGDLTPDLTVFLDIDLETSLRRARDRNRNLDAASAGQTRMDEQSAAFYERVRDGYLTLARREPGRFRPIDGRGDIERIASRIWQAVEPAVSGIHA
ncbi:MAG: dTMP kinase [Bryobacteraceae bacterium]|nr:dTMP kinase [Bryobacteraceae bacterium]